MKLKLSHTLYLGFSSLLLISVLLTLFVWQESQLSSKAAAEVKSDDIPGFRQYVNVINGVLQVKNAALMYLHRDVGAKAEFVAASQYLNQEYEKLVPLENVKAADIEKMNKIKHLYQSYLQLVEQEVFTRYNPADEAWAQQQLEAYNSNTGKNMEALLVAAQQEEYNDALKSNNLQESLQDDLPGVRAYLQLVDKFGDMQAALLRYVGGDIGQQQVFELELAQLMTVLAELRPLERKPAEVSRFEQIDAAVTEIRTLAEQIFQRYDSKSRQSAVAAIKQSEQQFLNPLEEILNTSVLEEVTDASGGLDGLVSSINFSVTLLLLNCLVILVVGGSIAWMLTRSVAARLNLVVEQTQKIAAGDLSHQLQIDDRGDEISELAKAAVAMQEKLRLLLGQILHVSSEVRATSDQVAMVSRTLEAGSHDQADKSTLIAAAVEEMAVSIQDVSKQTYNAADASQRAGEDAQQGSQLMQRTVSSIQEISVVVNHTSDSVIQLGKRSDEIGSVISVIKDIAEQTNLLALNAAIEAARAGEMGRGFAVVADEVRGLAERTSRATKDVGNLINSIQQETQLAVIRTQDGTRLVAQGVELANQAGNALQLIVERAVAVNNMVHAIAATGVQQAKATQEISQDINAISDIARHSLSQTQEGRAASVSLHHGVQQLDKLLSQFRL